MRRNDHPSRHGDQRIVLVRLSALGDIIHCWPLAEALRRARPDAHVTWIVEEQLRALVDGHPAVDAIMTVNTKSWRRGPFSATTRFAIASLRSRLSELQPDLCIDAQGVLKSAWITRLSGARRRVGLARPWRRELLAGLAYTEVLPGAADNPHVAATNLALLGAITGDPRQHESIPQGHWILDKAPEPKLSLGAPFAVLLPGAGNQRKVLKTGIWSEIAQHLGRRSLDVVVAWGPCENERALAITHAAGPRCRLAPPTSILELAALLGRAAVVIGGDTGPVHLAASLGVPTVAVFLATSCQRNRPLGDRVSVVCATRDDDRLPSGSAWSRRVRDVGAEEVLAHVDALLDPR